MRFYLHTGFPILSLVICLSLPICALAESKQSYSLSRNSSRVQFSISSQLFPIEGTIERYSGKLLRFGSSLEQFDLELECDLSSVRISSQELAGLPVDQLVSSLKGNPATFTGRPIAKTPKGELKVKGILKWKGKTYDVIFPVKVTRKGDEVVLSGTVRGNGAELAAQLPVLAMFQVESAEASVRLTFSPARP